MTDRDPKCVYVAGENGEARVIATWLTEEGFPADVMDEMTLGGFEGLTAILPGGISANGLEVWVKDAAHIDGATALLAERAIELRAERDRKAALTGDVIVTCEDCGRTVVFAAAQAGNVEDCPHCGSYIDVPDPGGPSFDVGDAEGD